MLSGKIRKIVSFLADNERKFRFLIVGAINTIFGLGLFSILYNFLGQHEVHYIFIFIMSYLISTTFSFFMNKKFVFGTVGNYFQEYLKFISFHFTHFCLNIIGLPIIVKFFDISPVSAQFLFAFVIIITSYFWYSRVAFFRSSDLD